MHVIANSVLPTDLVFDVGAHRGEKANWFSHRGARVIAIEPQPAMVALLRERFQDNPLVTVVPKGLSSQPGTLSMRINTISPQISTFSAEWKTGRFSEHDWDQTIDVEVTTLDHLIEDFGIPRYVKIDVEGFEKAVIDGLSRKVGAISLEFTGEFLDNTVQICQDLFRLGYSRYNLSLGEDDEFLYTQWIDVNDISLRLRDLCKENSLVWGDVYAI